MLADEVRQVFDLDPVRETGVAADAARLALSVEGLRTTTRVMHTLAWLLNYRAFYAGELTREQLRRHGTLPTDRAPEPDNLAHLQEQTRVLIDQSVRLHSRIARLDEAWRGRHDKQPSAIRELQQRLGKSVR